MSEEINYEEIVNREEAEAEESAKHTDKHGKRRFPGFGKKASDAENEAGVELSKLRKSELLEIMLAQGREIDRLRARVEELEKELDNRNFDFEKIGSLAEASIYVSNLFKEADKVVKTYVENVQRKYK